MRVDQALERKEPIEVKWVYKTKRKANGDVERYNERLVVKGYSQQHDIDYDEVFVPIVYLETIHLIINLAVHKSLEDTSNGCQIGIVEWNS